MRQIGPDPLETALKGELETGEALRWSGRPVRRVPIERTSFLIWLFAIPWTLFALAWTGMAAAGMASTPTDDGLSLMKWAFPAFGLPFVLIGFAMLASPLFVGRDLRRTIYGITDRRIIVLTRHRERLKVRSIVPTQIGPTTRRERKGVGKVTIETHSRADSDGDRRTETVDLIAISDPGRVERLVRELANQDATWRTDLSRRV